ncbi:MAG: hypothetical protein QXF12_07130 [Candidatus Aenigmatarchaeota archaeon]
MLIIKKIDNIGKCINLFKNKNDFMTLENIDLSKEYTNNLYRNYLTSNINVFIQKSSDKIKIIIKEFPNKIISTTIESKDEKNINITKNQDIIFSTYTITQESNLQYKKSKSFAFIIKNIFNVNPDNIKDFIDKTYEHLSMFLRIHNIDITFFITLVTYIAISIKKMSESSLKQKQGVIIFDKAHRINLQII